MQYVGSKSRLSKELAPIIQSYITEDTVGYLEPCVGGANMIDKIKHDNKIGIDIHEELIELLKYSQTNTLPLTITEEEYISVKNNKSAYPKWYVGLVGFCASFGSKYFGGFARPYKDKRDKSPEAIRNLTKQSSSSDFKNIKFGCFNFLDIPTDKLENYVIYCDIPYQGTTKYSTTPQFPYEDFYKWTKKLSKNNTVLISEYDMPSEFKCIWQKETKISLGTGVNQDSKKERVEKLFIVANSKEEI